MNKKQQYINWAAQQQLPLFHRPQWLDLVANNWDVALEYNGDQLAGALPYCSVAKSLGEEIFMPMLTPYLGPLLFYPDDQKYTSRLSFEKNTLGLLIDQLPDAGAYNIRCRPEFLNGLPFYWKQFQLNTRYTYILYDCSKLDNVFAAFRENVRREIKKAEKNLSVQHSATIDDLYMLKVSSYTAKDRKMPVSEKYIQNIHQLVTEQQWGQVISATDEASGQVCASVLFVWDHISVYYLLGAADPKFKTSGAMSLLMWQGIQLAAEKGLAFNFEGSMIPEIERFFAAFGGTLTPYLELSRVDNQLLKFKNLLK